MFRPGPAFALLTLALTTSHSADAPRFYEKPAFTIVYRQTGKVDAGEIIEHTRNWGAQRVEIKKTTTKIMGITQKVDQRVVYEGAKVTTIDNATGAINSMTNPLYDQVVASMKGRTGVTLGKELLRASGGRETGEKGNFAGESCDYWEVPSLGARSCVTSYGATLKLTSNLGGVSIEKTATEVRVGDSGPASAYQYDASKAVQQPNLQDIMKKMQGGR
jgi:hypothetical protein